MGVPTAQIQPSQSSQTSGKMGGSTLTPPMVPNGVSYSVGASGGGVAMWAELR